MWRFAATAWVGAATGDRRYNEATGNDAQKQKTPAVHECRAGGGEMKSRATHLRRRRSIVAPKALMSALVGSGMPATVRTAS
jgi:hypothetical protein